MINRGRDKKSLKVGKWRDGEESFGVWGKS